MPRNSYTAAQRSKMARLWANGASQAEIAYQVGRSLQSVASFMADSRDYFPPRRHRAIDVEHLIRLRSEGLDPAAIAEAMGFKVCTVRRAIHQHCPPELALPAAARPWTGAEVKRASALWLQGMRLDGIAAELGRTSSSVAEKAKEHRGMFPRRVGGRNRPIDIQTAYVLRQSGWTHVKIAEHIGATKNGVQKALQNYRLKIVEEVVA